MKVVTADAMQKIDREAEDRYGIPPIILMENAAISSAFCIMRMLKTGQNKVIFFCGQGNNGGDGFACARHLFNRGLKVKVYFAGKIKKLSDETRINYKILCKMGQSILRPRLSLLREELRKSDLIVDALLGIGLKYKVRQPLYSLIELINNSKRPVLSLDVPSGLDATSGEVCGIAVKATRTITFGLLKKGFLNPKAREYIGKLIIGDIGLPRQMLF